MKCLSERLRAVGGPGGGRGPGRGGRPGERGRDRDEHVVLDKVEGVRTKSPTYSPFASFFKKRDGTEDGDEGA
jgi:hypothetical protein